jgi:hypothetical protein
VGRTIAEQVFILEYDSTTASTGPDSGAADEVLATSRENLWQATEAAHHWFTDFLLLQSSLRPASMTERPLVTDRAPFPVRDRSSVPHDNAIRAAR